MSSLILLLVLIFLIPNLPLYLFLIIHSQADFPEFSVLPELVAWFHVWEFLQSLRVRLPGAQLSQLNPLLEAKERSGFTMGTFSLIRREN